jgi:DNA-binding IclR family transcriptional regulator
MSETYPVAGRKPRVQCLDRALDILEALARAESLGVTELAREVGLHVATVHNLLTVLLARGYLLNDAGRYRCGPALAMLGGGNDPLRLLPHLARPCLEEITRATGESAVVGMLRGRDLVMVATTPSADGLSCPAVNQAFRPALPLATGRLLVANRPPEEWNKHRAACGDTPPAPGEPAPTDREAWRRELLRVRQEGICFVRRGRDAGSVAVPVRDARGAVVASLGANSISRFGDSAHRARLVDAVRRAGHRVSAGLGYASAPAKAE